MMGIAESMLTLLEGKVRLPVVMDGSTGKVRQDTDSLHAHLAAFTVDAIVVIDTT